MGFSLLCPDLLLNNLPSVVLNSSQFVIYRIQHKCEMSRGEILVPFDVADSSHMRF